MAKRQSQSDHGIMVKKVADALIKKGYQNVKADISSYEMPDEIKWKGKQSGHIPDVTGTGEKKIIIEVETDDSIEDEHTADQWKLFSAYCMLNNIEFLIIVPEGSKHKAEKRMKELKVNSKVLEISI